MTGLTSHRSPPALLRLLPFAPHITAIQALSYLLLVCLFSISFLVFLNSSVSFVLTRILDLHTGVGDAVGTLGFVDELVALVACPAWGIASDRLGVRWVCTLGYAIVGVSLLLFVQAKNLYPQLLLARILFSIGGAATATMVTAILPSMTTTTPSNTIATTVAAGDDTVYPSLAPSLDSEATVTPESYRETTNTLQSTDEEEIGTKSLEAASSTTPMLAGLVGMLTGCGALVALLLFLPLPTRFSRNKTVQQDQALVYSFDVVGIIALAVAVLCFFGLRNIKGEEGKGWRWLLGRAPRCSRYTSCASPSPNPHFLPYWKLIFDSAMLGMTDKSIFLGYIGGFVARASSVAISLFIPLFVNAYFIRHGFCRLKDGEQSPDVREECRAAYLLSSELTGISQAVALVCAPLFGYASARLQHFNFPIVISAVFGTVGYVMLGLLNSPEIKNEDGRGGSPVVLLPIAMVGISQIGAIVCSLSLLGQGILVDERTVVEYPQPSASRQPLAAAMDETDTSEATEAGDTSPLLGQEDHRHKMAGGPSRRHLKGSIAGVYSLAGGAAILLLTKLGGFLFDALAPSAPFFMMAIFNVVLLLASLICVAYDNVTGTRKQV